MNFNFTMIALAGLVPLLLGFIWFHPKVFGTAWMNAAGVTMESKKGANMILIFTLAYISSFFVAFSLNFNVIHQLHMYSILANEPGINEPNSEIGQYLSNFMAKYGSNFRTFKHGALHGTLTGVFLIFPVIGVNALFERKSFKYVAINAGFWIACFCLMGGIICGNP